MGSPYITEILAWFNLEGYVFEILPFMNKNLFEILIERDCKPFDVCFDVIIPCRRKHCVF